MASTAGDLTVEPSNVPSSWCNLSDHVLLQIFRYLRAEVLILFYIKLICV